MIEAFYVSLNESDLPQPRNVASYLWVVEAHLLCDVRDPHPLSQEEQEDAVSDLVRDLEEEIVEPVRYIHT